MILCPFSPTKIEFFPTRLCIYFEDLESGFVPFCDGQEDKQRPCILRRQCKKVIFLFSPEALQEEREGRSDCKFV